MIEFKIVTTPDKSQQLLYQHEGDELVIGKQEGEMIIDDPQFGPRQLRIFFENGQPLIDNLDPNVEVRLNGKPVDGPLPLKERDNLTVARTQIQFLRVDLGPAIPPDTYVHPQADLRFKESAAERMILEVLGKLTQDEGAIVGLGATAAPGSSTQKASPGAKAPPPIPKGPPVPSVKPPLPPPIPKRPT